MGLDDGCAPTGDRFFGILNGLDTDALGPGDGRGPARRPTPATTWRARPLPGATCWRESGFDPDDAARCSG